MAGCDAGERDVKPVPVPASRAGRELILEENRSDGVVLFHVPGENRPVLLIFPAPSAGMTSIHAGRKGFSGAVGG